MHNRFARVVLFLAIMVLALPFTGVTARAAEPHKTIGGIEFYGGSEHPRQHKVVDGVEIFYGIVPSEIVLKSPEAPSTSRMHGGVSGSGYYHLIVALFDSRTGRRINHANVTARIGKVWQVGGESKKLEPMTIGGNVTYANFFPIPGAGFYRILLRIQRSGSPSTIEAAFKYQHP